MADFRSRWNPSIYRWQLVGMLWCISVFNYADRQALASVVELLQTEFNLSLVEIGLLTSAFSWVYGLGAPLAGAIVDRVRRRTAILLGLYAWSLICMATALSRTFGHLFFFRAAEGLGETFYYPASMSMLSDYHGKSTRSRALGLHQTSVYVGTIAGGFFAGLIGQHYGWRWAFAVFGGLGIALGVLLHQALIEPRRGAADELEDGGKAPVPISHSWRADLLAACKQPTVLLLMLTFVWTIAGTGVLLSWMPTYLRRGFGFDLAQAGFNATLYPQLASLVGAIVGGFWADRARRYTLAGRILVQAAAIVCIVPFVYLTGFVGDVILLRLALAAWGFFKGVYDANIFAAVFDFVPATARGTIAGTMNMLGWMIGGAAAPPIIGALAERHGLGWAISASALVYVLAAVQLIAAAVLAMLNARRLRFQAAVDRIEKSL